MSTLALATLPAPSPPPSCIRVKIAAAALNPADYKIAELGFLSRMALSYPYTPGMDLCGVVAAVGDSVTDVSVGDHVVGRADPAKGPGALAEQIVLSHDEYARISPSTDMHAGAALPTAALTAYQTLKPYVQAGDRVFINGGAGSTGTYGVQVAKMLGCHVVVSCSGAKAALCRELGADEVVDYKTTDIAAALADMQPFAHLVDNVGDAALYSASKAFLTPDARYVFVGGSPTPKQLLATADAFLRPAFLGGGSNKIVMFLTKNSHIDLAVLAGWLDEGKITSVLGSTYSFDAVKDAFDELKKGKGGKVIVHIS